MSRKGPRPLSATQQALGIRRLWPGEISIRRNTLTWVGQLQPTAASPSYKVRVAYRTGDVTRVHVLDPVLDPGHRDRLPHVYDGDRLCLYTPGEWDRSMQIATTIIPWTADWLFHYELWKATDHWPAAETSSRRDETVASSKDDIEIRYSSLRIASCEQTDGYSLAIVADPSRPE